MENVVQITRLDNPSVSYQGKVLERHSTWCRAIIITGRGNEVWDCNDDFWNIEYGTKVFRL